MKDGIYLLEIEDKGKGLSPQLLKQSNRDWTGALGVGVRGMNERMRQLGGTLELFSSEGGTMVRAKMPGAASSVPSA
jgi:signal transduction histidine kinase